MPRPYGNYPTMENVMSKVVEPGKYYTDRVHTHHVEVVVVTLKGQVCGQAHLMPGQRIKDMLNERDEGFIAITNATVTREDASTQHVKFIALNKWHIVSVVPLQDEPEKAEPGE